MATVEGVSTCAIRTARLRNFPSCVFATPTSWPNRDTTPGVDSQASQSCLPCQYVTTWCGLLACEREVLKCFLLCYIDERLLVRAIKSHTSVTYCRYIARRVFGSLCCQRGKKSEIHGDGSSSNYWRKLYPLSIIRRFPMWTASRPESYCYASEGLLCQPTYSPLFIDPSLAAH